MSLQQAAQAAQGGVEVPVPSGGALSRRLAEYATLLASEGALAPALAYLGSADEAEINALRERLSGALKYNQQQQQQGRAAAARQAATRQASGGRLAGEISLRCLSSCLLQSLECNTLLF